MFHCLDEGAIVVRVKGLSERLIRDNHAKPSMVRAFCRDSKRPFRVIGVKGSDIIQYTGIATSPPTRNPFGAGKKTPSGRKTAPRDFTAPR